MRRLALALSLVGIWPASLLLPWPAHADGNCYEQCSAALGGDTAVDEAIYEGCLNRCRNSQGPAPRAYFAAIAVSESDMKAGTAHGQPSRAAAEQLALQICQRNRGANCKVVNSGSGLCFALAMAAHHNVYSQEYDASRARAATKAIASCSATGVTDC